MERIRPDDYARFLCIADRCPITCCQEWKIGVDEETNHSWKKILPPEDVKKQHKNLSTYTIKKDDYRVIKLDEKHRCPFLAENKLCRLVRTYGDSVLSETCTKFPREVHRYKHHEEETLMPCCPAVIDIWREEEKIGFPDPKGEKSLLFRLRTEIIKLIQDQNTSSEEALLEVFYILQELYHGKDHLSETVLKDYFSKQTLKSLKEAVLGVPLPVLHTLEECNELLQDLSVNYRKEGLYQPFLNPVIDLAEQLSEGKISEDLPEKMVLFQEEWKRFAPLFRNFLSNEVFSDLLLPDGDLESVVIQMQWIALEYTAIRQSVFLKWLQAGRKTLTYETVRDYMVVLTRMTGYEEDDIVEYLSNSFESLVWDWGYFALIVGHGSI